MQPKVVNPNDPASQVRWYLDSPGVKADGAVTVDELALSTDFDRRKYTLCKVTR